MQEQASAQTLFDRGDFRGAREAAARAGDTAEARALLERLAPDPWAARFGALALLALVAASVVYLR